MNRETTVDMSPKAIDRRLRRMEQLRRLCLSLGRSKAAREMKAD